MKRMVAVPLLLLIGCRSESPDAQVRAAFETCRKAVEEGRPEPVTACLAKDFQGPEGMDRAQAQAFLMGVLRRQKVGVTVVAQRVEVDGATARQSVDLILTGKGGGLLPEDASRRTLHLRWRSQKGEWRLAEVREGEGAAR